jgi:hypothetical protein
LFVRVFRFVVAHVTEPLTMSQPQVKLHNSTSHLVPVLFDKDSGSFLINEISDDRLEKLRRTNSPFEDIQADLRLLFQLANKCGKLAQNRPISLDLPELRLRLVYGMMAKVSMMRYGQGITHGLLAGIRGVGKSTLVRHMSVVLTSLFAPVDLVVFALIVASHWF